MFNLNKSPNDKNPEKRKIKSEWLKFSSTEKNDELLSSFAAENKFVKDEIKIRSMVIDMLDKEFGKDIRNIKGYDYLVDSVVNKLKKKQLDVSFPSIEVK